MRRKFIGMFARGMNSIPVERPQDIAKRCKGLIGLYPPGGEAKESDALITGDVEMRDVQMSNVESGTIRLYGRETLFTTDLPEGCTIVVGTESIKVNRVVNDTIVEIAVIDESTRDLLKAPQTFKMVEKVGMILIDSVYSSITSNLKTTPPPFLQFMKLLTMVLVLDSFPKVVVTIDRRCYR